MDGEHVWVVKELVNDPFQLLGRNFRKLVVEGTVRVYLDFLRDSAGCDL